MVDARTIFADGIMDASVTYGVARFTLAQTGPDGKPVPAGQLVIPLMQLPAFANGIMSLLKQIETRVKEQQARQSENGEAAAGESASVPGAFRFG